MDHWKLVMAMTTRTDVSRHLDLNIHQKCKHSP